MTQPQPSLDGAYRAFLRWLAHELAPYVRAELTPPPRPGRFTFTSKQVATSMGLAFKITAALPAMELAADVATRELTTTVNGVDQPPVNAAPADADAVVGTFAVGDVLSVSLVDIDAGGLRSEARVETLTVTDTVAPPRPGEFGLSATQVETADAPPAGA